MFGERYFATRERLSDVMRGILSLASETGADVSGKLSGDELDRGLGEPFLFIVCGEVNAGKSTLINGLFGADLCKTNVLPETRRVTWHRHGYSSREVEVSPAMEEHHRPLGFLKDFHVVDTPGTNSGVAGHQETILSLLPAAELILFAFPVSNPWGAATWNFLSKLAPESLDRVVLVIQQADQRESADIDVILGHMRDLSMKRIGRTPRIFAVSGKLAVETKKGDPASPKALSKSGYPALEDFISREICESRERWALLESWRSRAASALRVVEDRIELQTRALQEQDHFLRKVEGEIDGMRERFVARLSRHLTGVAEVFQTEVVGVSKVLSGRLGAIRSIGRLFAGDRTGQMMESLFIERLQSAIQSVAEADGTEVVGECRAHWDELSERVLEALGIELQGPEPIDERLSVIRHRFVTRLSRIAGTGIGNLKVRNQLDKSLRKRNVALKSFTFMTLAFLTAGATCGAFLIPWLPGIFCGIAGFFAIGGIFASWRTRAAIVDDFRERLLNTCDAFAGTLRADYEDAIRAAFQSYGEALVTVRKHLAARKAASEPQVRRWQELFLTLKAIEQEL